MTRHRLTAAVLALALVAGGAAHAQPAVTVALSGLGSWSPAGAGEPWPGETRWVGGVGEYRLHLDQRGAQLRLTVCRDAADLPPANVAAVDVRTLTVTGEVAYTGEHRFHPHACPTKVWQRLPTPSVEVARAAVAAGTLPPYDLTATVTADTLQRIADCRYPWECWSRVAGTAYDPWTEEYGAILRGYVGGALILGGTEAAPLMPQQVAWLLSGDPRAWEVVRATAEASGNFAIHYRSRATGRAVQPAETGSLPFLQNDTHVSLRAASGKLLPVPDVAHQHSLVYLAALVTGERYYYDELEAWAAYNLLTRPVTEDRQRGIVWSGQVRAAAWAMRALLEAATLAPPAARAGYDEQIAANLAFMARHLTRPSGFASPPNPPYKASDMTAHFAADVTSQASTWNHHVLAWVLDRYVGAGYTGAAPLRDQVLKVAAGIVAHSPTIYDWPWGNHADATTAGPLEDWQAIAAKTFAARATPPTAFTSPVTQHYAAWLRAGLLAGVAAGQPWAVDALARLDAATAARWGALPVDWALLPRTATTTPPPPPVDPDPPVVTPEPVPVPEPAVPALDEWYVWAYYRYGLLSGWKRRGPFDTQAEALAEAEGLSSRYVKRYLFHLEAQP